MAERLIHRLMPERRRSLQTRYRYDGNQNLVLTIYPAGNADSAVYDERDLLFQSTRGTPEGRPQNLTRDDVRKNQGFSHAAKKEIPQIEVAACPPSH